MSRFFQRPRYLRIALISLTLCGLLNLAPGRELVQQAIAQQSMSTSLVEQGHQSYETGDFKAAIALWEQALKQASGKQERVFIQTNLGRAYRQLGQLDQAIAYWQAVIQTYQSQSDEASQRALAQLLTQQAQAYSELGQHQRAISLLQSAIHLANTIHDPVTETIAQGALGKAYWGTGDYDTAIATQNKAHALAKTLGDSEFLATLLNNLGNGYVSRAERLLYQANVACLDGEPTIAAHLITDVGQAVTAAQTNFRDSIAISQRLRNSLSETRALINLNRLQEQLPNSNLKAIYHDRERALTLLDNQPESREKAFFLINLAESGLQRIEPDTSVTLSGLHSLMTGLELQPLITSPTRLCDRMVQTIHNQTPATLNTDQGMELSQIEAILKRAIAISRRIGDSRTESYALGNLGRLYRRKYPNQALQLTQQAQLIAQQVNANDSLYRWQRQAGQLYHARGDLQSAIAFYRQSLATLKTIRSDIVAASRDLQFDFRDSVEPVYRELIELLLAQAQENKQKVKGAHEQVSHSSETLEEVLDVLESLKLAELQNFFGDECLEIAQSLSKRPLAIQDRTAVLYSIILHDRTEIILRLPNVATGDAPSAKGQLIAYSVPLGRQQMQTEVDQLRRHLEDRATLKYRAQAKKLYQALIRPAETDLAADRLTTLVFVNDGALRNVPMAALYDGQHFLIEKYAIATTPGLRLTVRQASDRSNLNALILGLTVERENFAALTFVKQETEEVQQILGGMRLLDRQFNVPTLQTQLQKSDYPIIHVATHSKFGHDAGSTYLLTFDGKLRINDLDNLLRLRPNLQPVELLTLSACETATGDNRAALGIAGVAVRAGVKSAVATLWNINDAATVPLIEEFYQQLRQPGVTKAEALRRAQLSMIRSSQFEYTHPAVWSSFVLIGNWL